MLEQDESAGFEWLDVPFALTRILISLLGTFCALVLLTLTLNAIPYQPSHPRPPRHPNEEPEIDTRTFYDSETSKTERVIGASIGIAIGTGMLASTVVAAMVVWRRPRLGFLLTGLAWTPFVLLGGLDCLRVMPILLLPLGWLGFAWWKVGRPTSARRLGTAR